MKNILLFIAVTVSVIANAQIRAVSLQASGLTCSMCSNAINKSLKTLDFVQDVNADIRNYTFRISFKPGSAADFDKIKSKVESAGFAVCTFVATIHFDSVKVANNEPVMIQQQTLLFQQVDGQVLNGEKQVRLLDKGYVSPKEFKKNTIWVSSPQTYHVAL